MRHRFFRWALFSVVLLTTGIFGAHAQTTVTIGTGTTTSYQVPVNMYYYNSIAEHIYTASEITGGGWAGGAGFINNLRWNIAATYAYTPQPGSTLSIYLENTMDASLSTMPVPGYTGGTLVWTGNHPLFNVTGWWNFTLANPFCYAGGNLYVRLVRTDFSYGSSSQTWYCSTTSTNQTRYRYWDSGTPTGDMNLMTTRPNMQMVMTTGTSMAYSSSTTTQSNTSPTGAGTLNQEIIGMEVVTTGCSTPLSVTSFTLNTAGSTNVADITNARVFYTGSSSTFSSTTQFGSTVANPSGSFTVTGSQELMSGTNYFWLAYDIAPGATAGNLLDAQCSSITVGGTARTPTVTNPAGSRSVLAPFSGIYTIDPNGAGSRNFTSFTSALDAMNAAGVVGATTFQVAAATYNEQLNIAPIPGASATNTVTFDGGTGNAASRIITYAVAASYGSVITLNGVDYLRLRNLTVNSTNGSYGYCILFTNSANYNEISNCVLTVPANTTTSYHIPLIASSTSSYSAYGDWGNYNLIKDNTLNNGYYGIRWNGYNSSSLTVSVGNEFVGNTIQDWYYYGMYLYYGAKIKVLNNRIVQRTTGTYTTSGGYGMYFYYQNDGPQIIGNYIKGAYYLGYIYYMNYYQTSTANRAKVINNMVVGNGTSTMYGMYLYYPRYADIVFNSLYTQTTGTCYGVYNYGSGSYDNKFKNNYIVHSGTGTWYPIYCTSSSYTSNYSEYDYNAYYRFGSGTTSYYWISTYSTLAALQAATTTVHDHSVEGNPYFVSETDLHSRSHVAYQAGIPFPGVTDDFDGDPRSATVPSIGADEYPTPPNENDMAVSVVRMETPPDEFAHLADPASHQVLVTVQNVGLSANPTNLEVVYKLGSMPADNTDGVAQTFSPGWDANNKAVLTFTQPISGLAPGFETVYARCFFPGDEDISSDTKSNGPHEIFGSRVHGYEDFEDMALMELPLARDPGYIPTKWNTMDIDNDGVTIRVWDGTFNGSLRAIAMDATSNPVNEWLFSPGAALIAGSSYRVGFEFKNWGTAPVTIECAYGPTPDPAAMTTYATFADIAPGGFLTAKQLGGGMDPYFNTPNFNQTYYLGFRFITAGGSQAAFSMDRIKLDDNPSPPPKIAYGFPGDPITRFIDDPAIPIIFNATYKAPGVINKTFAVATSTNIYGTLGDMLWDVETSTPWLKVTKSTPDPTLQGYNLTPPRPRQFQTFTLSVDPTGLSAGVHHGAITFYAILFNNDFPPPSNGLVASNEPFTVPVELRISTAGTKAGGQSMAATIAGPLTVPGSPYYFTDPLSGDPIATLQVTSGQIDVMTITVYPNQLPTNITRLMYVTRYWQIKHTGTGWTADITFPYTDNEAAMVLDRYQLRGVRQVTALARWENPIAGTSSTSTPMTNEVTVHNFNPSNIGGNIALAHPYMLLKDANGTAPAEFALAQNYPNPFNPSTSLSFAVAEERHVRLAVYNSLGVEVAELVNGTLPAGRYEVSFDASDLPSGTYVYTMLSGDFVQTRRMTLAK